MSTSSADFSAPLSTIDDSAPVSGWLTLGQRLPWGNFIRHGRWRIGWVTEPAEASPRKVLEPIEVAEPARDANALPTVVVPKSAVALRPRALILPPIFADALSLLFSIFLHSSLVIVLAFWSLLLPAPPRLATITANFGEEDAGEVPELAAAVGFSDDHAERRWEVMASTVDDFTASRASEVAVDAEAVAAVKGPEFVATSRGGPVTDVRNIAQGKQAADLLGEPEPGVEFFGIGAHGQRFVFIVDCSASMAGDKWALAKKELLRAVEQLGPEREFYVILFDGGPHPMFNDRRPALDPLPATAENIAQLKNWLMTIALGFNTSPCLAVKHGLDLEPSAMFLLTDGEFNDPTAGYLRENNRQPHAKTPKVVVNTISFGSAGLRLLSRIAEENGGEFRKVSP